MSALAVSYALFASGAEGGAQTRPPLSPQPPPAQVITQGGLPRLKRASLAEYARALPAPPQARPQTKGDLAAGNWTVEARGNGAKIERIEMGGEKDSKRKRFRLAVELAGGEKEFTLLRCAGSWRLKGEKGSAIVLVIHNGTEGALKIALAFSMGPRFAWHESKPRTIHPGWNRVVIDPSQQEFKARRSQWLPTAALPRRWRCRAVNLIVHNWRRTGRLVMDSLALSAGQEAKKK